MYVRNVRPWKSSGDLSLYWETAAPVLIWWTARQGLQVAAGNDFWRPYLSSQRHLTGPPGRLIRYGWFEYFRLGTRLLGWT